MDFHFDFRPVAQQKLRMSIQLPPRNVKELTALAPANAFSFFVDGLAFLIACVMLLCSVTWQDELCDRETALLFISRFAESCLHAREYLVSNCNEHADWAWLGGFGSKFFVCALAVPR